MAQVKAKIEKNKLGQLVTPAGSALFVSVPNASQFDPEKQEASIILSAEAFAEMEKQVEALLDACEEPLVLDRAAAKLNVKDATDAEGNLTGDKIIKAKTGMQYPSKLYDADNKVFVPGVGYNVPNRSKIRLAVSVELCKSAMFKGITLKLNGIKVITSTPWAGGDAFAGTEDDGDYVYNANAEVDAPVVDWAE